MAEICSTPTQNPTHLSVLSLDLAPGIDEIYEESQQVFLAPGHPQDGQVVFYKVSGHWSFLPLPAPVPASATNPTPNICMLWQISVDRGLKWEEAYAKSLELTGPHDGFYLSYKVGTHASNISLGVVPQLWGLGRTLGGSNSTEGCRLVSTLPPSLACASFLASHSPLPRFEATSRAASWPSRTTTSSSPCTSPTLAGRANQRPSTACAESSTR